MRKLLDFPPRHQMIDDLANSYVDRMSQAELNDIVRDVFVADLEQFDLDDLEREYEEEFSEL